MAKKGGKKEKRARENRSEYGEKLSSGGFKPGRFPLLSGKVRIVSQRTVPHRCCYWADSEKEEKDKSGKSPGQIGKIPRKLGKSQK